MDCPICLKSDVTAGHILGHTVSVAKTDAARINAKLGGWPRGKKRGTKKNLASKSSTFAGKWRREVK